MHRIARKAIRFSLILASVAGLISGAGLALLLTGAHGSLSDIVTGNRAAAITIADRSVSQPLHLAYQTAEAAISVDTGHSIAQVDPAYLSFALDAAQVTGAPWWDPAANKIEANAGTVAGPVFNFRQPLLDLLAGALAPAYFRIGGSEADRVWYAIKANAAPIPAGYTSILTRNQWDEANQFAIRNGLQIVFTLNAGPGPRQRGIWNSENAQDLIDYTNSRHYPVAVWEYGNELNGYWFIHGIGSTIPPEVYAKELGWLSQMVHGRQPSALVAGQGSAFWPVLGEPFSAVAGFMDAYLKAVAKPDMVKPDIIMWHYYPQQSRRSPVATRRAAPGRLLNPPALDEAGFWANKVMAWAGRSAPTASVWLGETGNAQFGGEPGVSDRWIGSLWWLDQLGLLAGSGIKVMIRQTLVGMDYGLLDEKTLTPRPDYWVSLLWKRLMGRAVYAPAASPASPKTLRVYAHSPGPMAPPGATVALVLVNLDPVRSTTVRLPVPMAQAWFLNAPDVLGKDLWLNGSPLKIEKKSNQASLPQLKPVETGNLVLLQPLSVVFLVW